MKKAEKIIKLIVTILICLSFAGCGTVFKGYYHRVTVKNSPKGLQVTGINGAQYPVNQRVIHKENRIEYESSIDLRTNKDHTLILKDQNTERIINVNRKLSGLIVFFDTLFFIFPFVIDSHTGAFYYFNDINYIKVLDNIDFGIE